MDFLVDFAIAGIFIVIVAILLLELNQWHRKRNNKL